MQICKGNIAELLRRIKMGMKKIIPVLLVGGISIGMVQPVRAIEMQTSDQVHRMMVVQEAELTQLESSDELIASILKDLTESGKITEEFNSYQLKDMLLLADVHVKEVNKEAIRIALLEHNGEGYNEIGVLDISPTERQYKHTENSLVKLLNLNQGQQKKTLQQTFGFFKGSAASKQVKAIMEGYFGKGSGNQLWLTHEFNSNIMPPATDIVKDDTAYYLIPTKKQVIYKTFKADNAIKDLHVEYSINNLDRDEEILTYNIEVTLQKKEGNSWITQQEGDVPAGEYRVKLEVELLFNPSTTYNEYKNFMNELDATEENIIDIVLDYYTETNIKVIDQHQRYRRVFRQLFEYKDLPRVL